MQILQKIKGLENKNELDVECIDILVRKNYFQSVKFLLDEKFGDTKKYNEGTGRELSKTQATVQSAIEYVRDQ